MAPRSRCPTGSVSLASGRACRGHVAGNSKTRSVLVRQGGPAGRSCPGEARRSSRPAAPKAARTQVWTRMGLDATGTKLCECASFSASRNGTSPELALYFPILRIFPGRGRIFRAGRDWFFGSTARSGEAVVGACPRFRRSRPARQRATSSASRPARRDPPAGSGQATGTAPRLGVAGCGRSVIGVGLFGVRC